MNTSSRLITLAAVAALLACGRTDAANKYWTGTGIWNTTNANWGTATGGPYTSTWSNAAPDAAIFEGTAGTVTLAMTATANGMTFNTTGYTVTGGTIAFGGTITVATSVTGTIESKLTGANTFTKSGAGTIRLANTANDFTGSITASSGVLEMAVIPNSSSRINFNGGTIRYVGATNTTTNRAIQIGTIGGSIQAKLESSGAGTINYSSSAAATAGGVPAAGAGLRLGGSNTGDNYWRGTLNDLLSIPIALNKVDAGTWIVTGNSNYTGGTTIGSGTLGFGSSTALGTGTVTFSGNATLRATVSGTLANTMSTGASSAVTATIDTQANAVTLSGSIGGSGNLTKIGTATLTLTSSNNAYTGSTTISAGTLALSGGGSVASSSGLNLSGTAAFDISAASGGRTVKALEGAVGSSVVLGGNTLTADHATTATFDGVISGSGGFTKAGGGTLTLSAVQAFTGVARVDSGTLVIGGTNTLAAASRIFVAQSATLDATAAGLTVGDGQTLGGYGTVSGSVSLLHSSTLSPGGSVGRLTVSSDVSWAGGSAYVFELTNGTGTAGSEWDLLSATSLSINATPDDPYRIMLTSLTSGTDHTLGSMTAGNWNPDADSIWMFVTTANTISSFDPAAFTIDQSSFDPYNQVHGLFAVVRGDSIGESDTDLYIVYMAVPEPSTLAAAAIGLVAACWVARRRLPVRATRRGT